MEEFVGQRSRNVVIRYNIPFGVFTRRHENCRENDGGYVRSRAGRVTEDVSVHASLTIEIHFHNYLTIRPRGSSSRRRRRRCTAGKTFDLIHNRRHGCPVRTRDGSSRLNST